MENKFPKGWETPLLGDVVTIKSGNSKLTKKKYIPNGKYTAFSGTGPDGKTAFYEHEGDAIILSAVGARCGKCFRANGKWTAIANTSIIRAKTDDPAVYRYLFYMFNNENFWPKGGTGQPFVKSGVALKEMRIPFPPIPQQKRIADRLDSLLSKVKDVQFHLDKIPLILKHLKQSIFLSASKPSNGSWEEYTLSELCDFNGGGTPSRNNAKFWNGNIPWVSPKDMKRDRIEDSKEHISEEGLNNSSTRMIPKGAILFVVRGMILNHTLPVAITDKPVAINQDMKALIPKDKELAEYLFLACKAASLQILFYVKEATHGTRRIETDILKEWKISVPPRSAVNAIVAKAQKSMALVDSLEKRFSGTLTYTNKLDQSILAKAFRGELVRQG